ncbi:MAE_28990/MAE_18760 family HEPN-like nuclease [aff. Roholtiella sp. LEGE 12411]|uniref:MAE_28990/MAE_18760 family HEPN-like nuclease n=1 Tax=aff. Roholtiella sp. LEGE 12411 TaxID=1828822 RepID=UPI00187E391B|nr:MAE_28990/MAE_18760 family HEPN-like nuclease [aff. Roholtiella sp. LEGE 12411]MBE9036915.1 hypothetical protein [aff. Roholtiella sp. LEGE 12411]
MFQNILMTVRINISTVRSIVKTNDWLKEISFGAGVVIKQEWHEETELILGTLMQDIPKVREWRVYDHCAVVTRLYAIYERFVEDLVSDWLVLLPSLFPLYSDLEERIRNTHQTGVGRLLLELKKNRYAHLSIEEVMRGLFHGFTGEKQYELLPDAFLFHEQNLRRETLEKLFADAGIINTWGWVEKHRAIKYFLEEIRGNQNTAEGELNELISYRNDAAHGSPDDVLGTNALLELCDFVETLCQAITELVTYQVIERKKSIGQAREVGKIIEWYKKHEAGVAKFEATTISVGSNLFLVSQGTSCCQLAIIESIQNNGISVSEVQTTTEMEVGLKFDVDAKKGLRLYQLYI